MDSVKMFLRLGLCTVFLISSMYGLSGCKEEVEERTRVIELWSKGKVVFGSFVLNEREPGALGPDGKPLQPLYTRAGGERLAQNELLDYVLLDFERFGEYDLDAVTSIVSGLESGKAKGGAEKSLIVRLPPIWKDGEDVTRKRISEVLAAGADGILLPEVRSAEMTRTAVSFFSEIGANVWSPQNPDGTIVLWLMIEDPDALAEVEEIANVPGYSVLACGIGQLTPRLGDAEAAEAANQLILEHAKRTGHPSVARAIDVAPRMMRFGDGEQKFGEKFKYDGSVFSPDVTTSARIDQGFLGFLALGPDADKNIRIGREYLKNR